MNHKIISFSLIVYMGAAAIMLLLHCTLSRNGQGNEFIIFGFPLLPLFLAGMRTTDDELSRIDVIAITVGCFAISAISIPIHYIAPERLLNPYCGPLGILMQIAMLSIIYAVYTCILKSGRTRNDDRNT